MDARRQAGAWLLGVVVPSDAQVEADMATARLGVVQPSTQGKYRRVLNCYRSFVLQHRWDQLIVGPYTNPASMIFPVQSDRNEPNHQTQVVVNYEGIAKFIWACRHEQVSYNWPNFLRCGAIWYANMNPQADTSWTR